MRRPDENQGKTVIENLIASLAMLSFGLAILAFLIAIDRPEWFNLRPASGTAAAMSNASEQTSLKKKIEQQKRNWRP